MEQEIKLEARRQYLKYFRVWFLIIACLFVVWCIGFVIKLCTKNAVRENKDAPVQRVYDYADVLTTEEEQRLEEYIAECENKAQMDIVLLTLEEEMESKSWSYESAMMHTADDFYDEQLFGYNKVHGDGVLLLDNWKEGQKGSWLSTCGRLVDALNSSDIDFILDEVYFWIEDDPYEAYRAYVKTVTDLATVQIKAFPTAMVIFLPMVIALVFACTKLQQSKAKDTTNATAYVAGGKPVVNVERDDFIRKNVVKRHIQRESSSGGSRSSSGGGGSHRSSSGVSHGGGGRRR